MRKQIEEISKKIFEIRKAMGYATDTQIKEGWQGEMKIVKFLIKDARKLKREDYECVGCGGFTYTKSKSGDIKITPDFSWIVKRDKKLK